MAHRLDGGFVAGLLKNEQPMGGAEGDQLPLILIGERAQVAENQPHRFITRRHLDLGDAVRDAQPSNQRRQFR